MFGSEHFNSSFLNSISVFTFLTSRCTATFLHNFKFPRFLPFLFNSLFILLLPPLALQPVVGFGLSNNTSPFVPIYHQLSPSSQHFKISFHFFSPSFPGSSSSSRSFQFLSEDLFGHPVLLHSLPLLCLYFDIFTKNSFIMIFTS